VYDAEVLAADPNPNPALLCSYFMPTRVTAGENRRRTTETEGELPRCEKLGLHAMEDSRISAPRVAGNAASRRRAPVQTRSQHTVQRVLDAAGSLLQQISLDEITTTRIAAEAGLSIGALYRFFPDKQSIIDAIAVRHVEQFKAVLESGVMKEIEREFANLASFDPAKVLNSVVYAYIIYLDQHPDFRTISFGRHISRATKEREASPDVGLPAFLKNFMLQRLGIENSPQLDLRLRVVSEAGEGLIAYAYEQPLREERDTVIAEMKRMLAGYLFG
jgi:AcrR family transcriptional regulator